MNTKLMATKQTISLALSLTLFGLLPGAIGCKDFFVPVTSTSTTITPVTNTGDFAYVASVNTGSTTNLGILSGFTVGTGTLTAISGFPLLLPFAPSTAVVTPSNAFLYVCGQEVLYGYSIASNGVLTGFKNANASYALENANILQMVVSPDGNWLLGLDQTPDGDIATIDEYAISSTGQLSAGTPVQYAVTGGATLVPNGIAISPNGDYVAIALGTGGVVLFSFNTSTGVMTQVGPQINTGSTSGADQAVAFDSTSSILFVAQSGTGAGVVPFVISNSGATLTAAAGAPFPLGAGASSMVVDSTGKYLYVGNKVDSTISGFSIGTGGVLTQLTGSPYTAGTNVDALARDNSGKYLLSTSLGTPDLKMYSFDATSAGALDASTTAATGDPTEPAGAVAIAATH